MQAPTRTLLLAVAAAFLATVALGFVRLPSAPRTTLPSSSLAARTQPRFPSSSDSFSKLYNAPPGRPTRKNEPNEYFKSNLEKKEMSERLVDPQVLIALVGILLPFVAVGVLFAGGFLTR